MKLTRKQVLSRAKASELDSVRKLNCWGSRLTDISICHELPNIEVMTLRTLKKLLSSKSTSVSQPECLQLLQNYNSRHAWTAFGCPVMLGVVVLQQLEAPLLGNTDTDSDLQPADLSYFYTANSISTLEPIRSCQNLTELYLRKNNISNMSELYYLKHLPKLKILWLSENPCCNPDPHKYRMTVLRNLPNLQKLDNQAVTAEEVSHSITEGEEITAAPTDISKAENGSPGPTKEPACGEVTTESENDLLNFSMEETNKIREQLGMKPLSRDKFSPFSSPVEPYGNKKRKNNVLNAVLLLLKELDTEALEIVQRTAENRIHQLQRKELQQER